MLHHLIDGLHVATTFPMNEVWVGSEAMDGGGRELREAAAMMDDRSRAGGVREEDVGSGERKVLMKEGRRSVDVIDRM